MAVRQRQPHEDQHVRVLVNPPLRVIIAYDQLTPEERGRVHAALQELDRKGTSANTSIRRLTTPDPLYALNATPDITVFVRMEPGAPVEVMDIVRTGTLRNFARAALDPSDETTR